MAQALMADTPETAPLTGRLFMFPGQGSQQVGMGKTFYDAFHEARAVFEEVDDALGMHLSRLIFDGPENELTLTRNAQPAIMTSSLAIFRVLEKELGLDLSVHADFVAGHSLGEYSALAAAGALSIADSARLLQRRGDAMQEAVPVGKGAMAALLGLDTDIVKEIAKEASDLAVCESANDNAPGQVVVSGDVTAITRATEIAKERGARKAVMLSVSAPFHCSLMQPAADVMAEALAEVKMKAPIVPLITNVTAQAESDPERIRSLLVEQVTGMVRWRESMLFAKESGVQQLVEVGEGKVLSGLARRIDRDLSTMAIDNPQALDALAANLTA